MKKLLLFLFLILSKNLICDEVTVDTFEIDLNLDKISEKVVLSKKNGLDQISIFKSDNELLFKHEITPMGKNSFIKKITHVKVNSLQQCLLLHYMEGQTGVKAPKRSSRLLSFCFHTANLKKITVQDLGYLFWDMQSVASYMKEDVNLELKDHFYQSRPSALLILKQLEKVRSWQFDTKESFWIKLPERMYAEYAVRPSR